LKIRDLDIRVSGQSRSLKVVPLCRSCMLLLVFFSKFAPKTHRFWDIRLRLIGIPWPWNPGYGVTQGHRKLHHSIRHPQLPINVL